jgi:hypothetical protein
MKTNSLNGIKSCCKNNIILKHLDIEMINRCAVNSGFLKRVSEKITPVNLILGFMIMASKHRNSYAALGCEIGFLANKTISKQAVEDRMTPETEEFSRTTLEEHLCGKLGSNITRKTRGVMNLFTNVKVDDTTVLPLADTFVNQFPGSVSRGIRKAQAKIHALHNLTKDNFDFFHLHSYSENDQSLSANVLPYLQKGDLLIRDLGLTILSVIGKIIKKKAYFISRKNYNIKVFDSKNAEEINLVKELKKKGSMDQEVMAGKKKKTKVRLIAIPLPKAQANDRRRKARNNRDKRLKYSPDYDYLLGYSIFLTNVESDKCNPEQIAQLYRIRWRIEIIFKSWKSCFSMQSLIHIQCTNPVRIRCTIYLLLFYIYLFHVVWWNHYQTLTKDQKLEQQLSILKMAHFFNEQFSRIIILNSDRFIMKQLLKHCSYDKRKDRTNAAEIINKLAA